MKKYLILLALALVGFALSSCGNKDHIETITIDGMYLKYTRSGNGVVILDAIATGDVKIPSKLGNLPVTFIGKEAFCWCTTLTSIVIPDSVTSIDDDAFSFCPTLTSIEVAKGNRNYVSVDNVLFSKDMKKIICCSKNKASYSIPEGVTSIGDCAFSDCDRLTSIVIPSSVTSIGDGAFLRCQSLTSIVIPKGVTSIGDRAFSMCKSLTSIVIPSSVTSIGDRAFSDCDSLTSIVIPSSVTSIGDGAFSECKSLTSIKLPRKFMDNLNKLGIDEFDVKVIPID